MHNSITYVPIYLFSDCYPEAFFSSGSVIGMDAPLEFFKSRRPSCGIESRYTEDFLGPVGVFADRRDACPTAGVAQPLRFRQIRFASPQDFFRAPALGDIGDRPDKFQRPRLIFLRSMAYNVNVL